MKPISTGYVRAKTGIGPSMSGSVVAGPNITGACVGTAERLQETLINETYSENKVVCSIFYHL